MATSTETTSLVDLETLRRIDGLYIGQLTEYEDKVFRHACRVGMAKGDYSGASGWFLGLGKVRMAKQEVR